MKLGSRFILIAAFLLILIAGIVLGRVWRRLPPPLAPNAGSHSWLTDQLNLSPEQKSRMDAIWDETRREMDEAFQKRRAMDQQRRQQIVSLLTPAQKAEYDRINHEFSQERRELDKQREALIHQAQTRSRELLTTEQRETWDKINNRRQQPRPGDRRPRHDTTQPSSRPMMPGPEWPMHGE